MTYIYYRTSMVSILLCLEKFSNFFLSVGTRSFKQTINFEVWAYSYLEFAKKADTFFPEEFRQAADAILAELGMRRHDITTDSARAIYLHLCESIQ